LDHHVLLIPNVTMLTDGVMQVSWRMCSSIEPASVWATEMVVSIAVLCGEGFYSVDVLTIS